MLKSSFNLITFISKILVVRLEHSFGSKEGKKFIMYAMFYVENDYLNGFKSIFG